MGYWFLSGAMTCSTAWFHWSLPPWAMMRTPGVPESAESGVGQALVVDARSVRARRRTLLLRMSFSFMCRLYRWWIWSQGVLWRIGWCFGMVFLDGVLKGLCFQRPMIFACVCGVQAWLKVPRVVFEPLGSANAL